MQYPVGMAFNPDTVRNEMVSFWAVAFSPVAIVKFFHTVLSGWIVGAVFVVGVSAWYLIRNREKEFAMASMKLGAVFGLIASLIVAWSGDISGVQVARNQPMKLAAMENLQDGGHGAEFTIAGDIKIPKMLSLLATHNLNGYVPGINNLLEGGYMQPDSTIALSAAEKIERGKQAITALGAYRDAKAAGDEQKMQAARKTLDENIAYFGYGYIKDPADLVPPIGLTFWSFRIMVGLGMYFIAFFGFICFLSWKRKLGAHRWLYYVALWTIPLGIIAGQAGWIVAEVGRQPWAIQGLLPVNAAISKIETGSVQLTFWLFLLLFTIMLIAEIRIMIREIQKGPEPHHTDL